MAGLILVSSTPRVMMLQLLLQAIISTCVYKYVHAGLQINVHLVCLWDLHRDFDYWSAINLNIRPIIFSIIKTHQY